MSRVKDGDKTRQQVAEILRLYPDATVAEVARRLKKNPTYIGRVIRNATRDKYPSRPETSYAPDSAVGKMVSSLSPNAIPQPKNESHATFELEKRFKAIVAVLGLKRAHGMLDEILKDATRDLK